MDNNLLMQTVIAAREGKSEAFDTLFIEFKNTVYNTARQLTGDRDLAEDVTQDVFMEVIKSIHTLREPAAFVGWLKRITANQCVRYARKWREDPADENEDGSSILDIQAEEKEEFLPGAVMEREDLRKVILELISQLPDAQRSALVMHYYQNLSIKDIAQIEDTGENTIKSRLFKARKAMRDRVEQYEQDNDIKLYDQMETDQPVQPVLPWVFQQEEEELPQENTGKIAQGISDATGKIITGVPSQQKQPEKKNDVWQKILLTIVAVAFLIGCIALLIFALGGKEEAAPTEPKEPAGFQQQTEPQQTQPQQTEATQPETTQATQPETTQATQPQEQVLDRVTGLSNWDNLTATERRELVQEAALYSLIWEKPVLTDDVATLTAEQAVRLTAPYWTAYDTRLQTFSSTTITRQAFDDTCLKLLGTTYDCSTISGDVVTYDAQKDQITLSKSVNWLWSCGHVEWDFVDNGDGTGYRDVLLTEDTQAESRCLGSYTLQLRKDSATGDWVLQGITEGWEGDTGVSKGDWWFIPEGEGDLRTDGIYYAATTDMDGNKCYRYIRVLEGNKIISKTSTELELPGEDWDADDVQWLDHNSRVDQGSLMWWGLGENKRLQGSLLLKSGGHYFMHVQPYANGLALVYTYDFNKQDSPDRFLCYKFVPFN